MADIGFPAGSRLIYVIGQLSMGGSERQLWYLLNNMDRDRYRPAVVVWSGSPKEHYAQLLGDLKVPLCFLPREWSAFSKLRHLRRIVLTGCPEVVHSFSFHLNFTSWWAARRSNAIAIGSIRNDYEADLRNSGEWRSRISRRWPGKIISNSKNATSCAAQDRSFWHPPMVSYVPNGVDTQAIGYVEPQSGHPTVVILGIGRLHAQKRWDVLIRSLALMDRSTQVPWLCRIYGEGSIRAELEAITNVLGLAARITFEGVCSDVAAVLGSAHVLALTSDYEGTPNVVLEAMACGRPIVATAVGDVGELVEDKVSGFLVKPGDVESVAKCLLMLVEDSDMRVRMGVQARQRVSAGFGLESLVENIIRAYEQCGWAGR